MPDATLQEFRAESNRLNTVRCFIVASAAAAAAASLLVDQRIFFYDSLTCLLARWLAGRQQVAAAGFPSWGWLYELSYAALDVHDGGGTDDVSPSLFLQSGRPSKFVNGQPESKQRGLTVSPLDTSRPVVHRLLVITG